MLYRPFSDDLAEVSGEELERLRNVHEGWYVEYKQQLIGPRELAKSLSSFANQYGGWLFLGIVEDGENHVAKDFPGIPDSEIPNALESLKNAAKDLLNPPLFYNVRTFPGPIDSIGLREGRSIIVAQVPEGPNSPYIHNDGRIYRRVGDSSQPTSVSDRATFDLLALRGEETRSRLTDRVLWSPVISQAEENQPFLHLSILSDPYETMGHWYDGKFSDFSETMKGHRLPFDNLYTTPEGFIARQVGRNNPDKRILTWHFSKRCHSFITIPISTLHAHVSHPIWREYTIGMSFLSKLASTEISHRPVLELNLVLNLLGAVLHRHRVLVSRANILGPFYLKARLENIWRTIPFIDHSKYLDHINTYGFPFVQVAEITVPGGKDLSGFIVTREFDHTPKEEDQMLGEGAILLGMNILNGLGIPMEVLAQSIEELRLIGRRSQEIQEKLVSN